MTSPIPTAAEAAAMTPEQLAEARLAANARWEAEKAEKKAARLTPKEKALVEAIGRLAARGGKDPEGIAVFVSDACPEGWACAPAAGVLRSLVRKGLAGHLVNEGVCWLRRGGAEAYRKQKAPPTPKLTEKELELIVLIAEDQYANGQRPERGKASEPVWTWSVTESGYGMGSSTSRSRAAVLGSLIRKGLAGSNDYGRDDQSCWLTPAGVDVYLDQKEAEAKEKAAVEAEVARAGAEAVLADYAPEVAPLTDAEIVAAAIRAEIEAADLADEVEEEEPEDVEEAADMNLDALAYRLARKGLRDDAREITDVRAALTEAQTLHHAIGEWIKRAASKAASANRTDRGAVASAVAIVPTRLLAARLHLNAKVLVDLLDRIADHADAYGG